MPTCKLFILTFLLFLSIRAFSFIPPAPVARDAASVTSTSFTARWYASVDATSYRLDVSTSNVFSSFVSGYNNVTVTTVSKSVTGLSAGITYYYRVRAVDATGTSGNSAVIIVGVQPAVPTAIAPSLITTSAFNANWNAASNASDYLLDVSTDAGFSTLIYNGTIVTGTQTYVNGLSAGVTYYYRVRARNASGTSVNSNVINVLLLPPPPLAVTATNLTSSSFTANWNGTLSASSYQVDISISNTFSSFVINGVSVIGNSYTVNGLTPGSQYYYRVRAVNASGVSVDSNVISAVTAVPVPTNPVATAGSLITSNSFTANWNPVTWATGYQIDVSLDGFNTFVISNQAVSSTSINLTGLLTNVNYSYRIRATNASGVSANSNSISLFTISNPPVAIPAGSVTTSSFIARWNAVPDITNFAIDIATDINFNSIYNSYLNYAVTGQTLTLSNLPSGTSYYYRVKAVNSAGNSIPSNTIRVDLIPGTPVAQNATIITGNSFTAHWGNSTNATGYLLEVSTYSDFSVLNVPGFNSISVSGNQKLVNGLTEGITYYYRVKGTNNSGASAPSNIITLLTLPPPPIATACSFVSVSSFIAHWNGVSNVSGYELDVATDVDFVNMLNGYNGLPVQNNSYQIYVPSLTGSVRYYYRIRAVNASGQSFNSNVILAAPEAPIARTASDLTERSFTANWDIINGIKKYKIDVSEFPDFIDQQESYSIKERVTEFNDEDVILLKDNKTYYYRIKSTTDFGDSPYSNVISVTTLAGVDYNYITTKDIQVNTITTQLDIDNSNLQKVSEQNVYFDGLSRPIQTVKKQFSPMLRDLVQPAMYDLLGRQEMSYLPYVSSGYSGSFREGALEVGSLYTSSEQYTFYNASGQGNIVQDESPVGQRAFEASPLNRPSSDFGVGKEWLLNNKSNRYFYLLNKNGTALGQEKIIAWSFSGDLPVRATAVSNYIEANGYYSSGQITIKSTIDEHGFEVREYKDKNDRLILKKIQFMESAVLSNSNHWAQTYYIYDDFGNLRIVLQPELTKIIYKNDVYNPTVTDLANLAFQYMYDSRGRMIMKQVPGALPVYMVYDNRDRLILTQDGVQRSGATNAIKYWNFTKYDELNRPILTGIKDTTTTVELTQAQMQSAVDAHFAKVASKWSEVYIGNAANNVHGYTNNAYPVRTGSTSTEIDPNKYLTITYYDNYIFRSLWQGAYTYLNESLSETANSVTYTQPATESTLVKGQVTGMKVKILDGGITGAGAWIRSVNYYDDKNRPVQSISDNIAGGIDRSTTVLDFTGKVLKNKTSHSILWKDMVGVEATPAGLTRTLVGTGWTAGAASVDILPNGVNGWVEVQVAEMNKLRMIGLSKENTNTSIGSMDYAVNLNLGNYSVYENGVNRGNKSTITTGDIIRIERTGSTVKYLKNGLEVFTSTVASSTPLMADATLNEYGATLPNLNFSFKNTIPRSITRRFEYDHAGRLMKTWHQVDAQAEILLSSNTYNELGQLVDKKLHSTVATAANAKQSIDYRYNIRGWLTKINESDIETGKNDASNAGEARDYFGMELGYNNDIGLANTSLYNGNISAMKWSKNQGLGTAKESAYNYSYDPMNRITAAAFQEKATNWNALANNGFSESNYTYDLNGNILTLTRYDQRGSTAPMDNLTLLYSYGSSASQSNKLLKVTDTGDVNAGFLDGATATTEYGYNDNGSMTFDSNKEIKSPISYNYLNLPELLTRGTSNTIRYIYDATGRKLSQVVTYNTSKKRTDYMGEYQYENSVLQSISHEEGRIAMSNELLVYQNDGDNSTGFTTNGATMTPVTQNTNQTYLKVVSNGTTSRTGLSNVVTLGVVPGERYKIRAKGYRDKGSSTISNPVYLLVQCNGTDKDFPGATLGSALTSEAWTEQIVTIPAAMNTLQAGIIWNTTVTTGELFYLNDFEVIKLSTNAAPEYQYMLKDHLGNVRVTFTTKDETDISTATLETANANAEQGQFLRYENARKVQSTWFDHTNGAATGYAERLNGTTNEKYGIAHSISVMPGDKINAEVYAKFVDNNSSNWTSALNTLLSQIAAGTASATTVIDGAGYSSSTSSFSFPGLIDKSGAPVVGPKAYLNWLVFDKNYVFLTGGFKKMSDIAKEYGQDVPHELIFSPDINITQPGYVYIYLSNEETTPVEVYFDDFKVTHTKSPVVQQEEYYPFGLAFNSYQRENSVANQYQYQYNGKETQDELELNTIDFGWRQYDPTIGRWNVIDQLAEKYYPMSPYNFVANNPINFIDPDGREIAAGSKNEWDKQRNAVEKTRDKLQGRIDKLKAKAESKGWSSEKLESKTANLSNRVGLLNTNIATLGRMEQSSQVYRLAKAGELGGTTFDPASREVVISYGSTANFVHETTHAGQFENQELGFNSRSGESLGQDLYDEVDAYRAQWAYSPASVSQLKSSSAADSFGAITTAWVTGITLSDKTKPYAQGGAANTGIISINLDSSARILRQAYPGAATRFIGVPDSYTLKSSANTYYKVASDNGTICH